MQNGDLYTYFLWSPSLDFSCDGFGVVTLDTNYTIWYFQSWGRPYQLVSPLLDFSSPETTPIQIKKSLQFFAALMRSGDVYVWQAYPSHSKEAMVELDMDESTRAIVPDGGTVIPCHTQEMKVYPVKLPIPPDLPDLPMTALPEEECRKETKFIKIAAFDHGLIGLTNKGHVCLFWVGLNQMSIDQLIPYTWHYVSESPWMI